MTPIKLMLDFFLVMTMTKLVKKGYFHTIGNCLNNSVLESLNRAFTSTPLTDNVTSVLITYSVISSILVLITLAGTPPTMVLAGTSLFTTAPAATIAFSPTVTPGKMVALEPIHAFFLMVTALPIKECLIDGSSG